MKLSMQVGLGPGHIVLDGNPASPPTKGHSSQFSAHVCCGQTAGWIKMPLGMEVGLGPGDYVLDGDPALLPKKGQSPNFRPMSIVAKRLDGSRWHVEVGLGPGHILLDGDPARPLPKKVDRPPIFGPCLLWLNGWMDQDATWHGGRTRPRRHCVRWRPSSPRYRGTAPQFSANICCGQRADWTKVPLGTEVGRGPVDFVFDGNPAPPRKKGTTTTKFWPMSIVDKRLDA